MLRSGDAEQVRPMLRWYLALLPAAMHRTQLWYNNTHPGVKGAWFIETMTQFGTFMPSEKGYHCPAIRETSWPIWWAGNHAVNIHRLGSIELIMLGLDYWDHTQDQSEFNTSILPLSTAVLEWVRTYFGRTSTGQLDIWPTQALEGYYAKFPPNRQNIITNDMPMVAGLRSVIPRLLLAARENDVPQSQIETWQALYDILPPLPTTTVPAKDPTRGNVTVFTAAQLPYAPNASHGGSEVPMDYPIHPFRLATVMYNLTNNTSPTGLPDDPVQVGRDTIVSGHGDDGDTGWQQKVMNLAYLGLAKEAYDEVVAHAQTSSEDMRFPAYLPNMQDFRPNVDHLSNMRTAVQTMLVQHGDVAGRSVIGMLPAWPCDTWSVDFKVHMPLNTIVEGSYNHTTRVLRIDYVSPASREKDIRIMGCSQGGVAQTF